MEFFKNWIKQLQELSGKNFKTIVFACVLVTAGGILATFFGWPFATFVPAWIVFVAFVLKKKYKG
jgi:hypothetical protein